ncbi:MAG: DUF3180 domain-containing protein [Actinomycetaceae bacterium]|nr:DUF3180 domain-containing protein [Actinomycetaceae bacterium]
MRLTTLGHLAFAASFGGGLAVIACAFMLADGRAPGPVPATLFLPILAVALGIFANGWRVRRMRQGKATRMRPLQAARVAVFAQACSRSGAFFVGLAGVCALLFSRTGRTAYVHEQVLALGLAAIASLLLTGAGWLTERWCAVDEDEDDPDADGLQASGAST